MIVILASSYMLDLQQS